MALKTPATAVAAADTPLPSQPNSVLRPLPIALPSAMSTSLKLDDAQPSVGPIATAPATARTPLPIAKAQVWGSPRDPPLSAVAMRVQAMPLTKAKTGAQTLTTMGAPTGKAREQSDPATSPARVPSVPAMMF